MSEVHLKHKKDEYVVYKKSGIYLIEDIRREKIGNTQRCYYVLRSVYDFNSTIYVPADNKELVNRMDKVLSKDEIELIIAKSQGIELEYEKDATARQNYYEEIFIGENLSCVVALMKMLMERKAQAHLTKAKIPALDERTLANCQKVLCEAFAFSLQLPKSEIVNYILTR